MNLTKRQESFVNYLFQGIPQNEAYIKAGYSSKMLPATIYQHASRLAKMGKVKARLVELRNMAASPGIMSVQERKERLSEIARGNLTDYQEAGADGAGYISITKDSPNTAAIAGIESATKFDENGNTGTLFTKVKLHDPTKAIDLLNKMDKIYSDNPVVNVDNRKLIIVTDSEKAKQLTEAIAEGIGTE